MGGHKADDLLPFGGLMSHQDTLYTNLGFYKLTHPDNENIPYVYDSLSYWEGCYETSVYEQYLLSKPQMPATPTDDSTSSTNQDDPNSDGSIPPINPDDPDSDGSIAATNPDDANSDSSVSSANPGDSAS